MLNEKTMKALRLITAGAIFSGLAACGGGGSNSSDDGTTVSGTATAPGGAVAQFENSSLIKLAGQFFIPQASAAITGLEPVTGATVELIEINNDGNQVGDVIASTQTSITGAYELNLPAGIDFAANLILRITSADNSKTLDAQVLTQSVNINPYSDFLLDKLVENGTQLDTLAVNEALVLKGQLEEFDLTAGANLEEMFEALEAATGEFMDHNIAAVNNGEGNAASVAGSYHVGEFSISLHDSDNEAVGTFASDLIQESMQLTANEGADLTATFDNARIDTWYNLLYFGTEGSLNVENAIENFPEEEMAQVDGAGALIFQTEFEEDIDDCDSPNPEQDCFGWRYPASTLRIEPASSTGFYFGRVIDAGVRYHLTEDKVLDPDNKDGDEVFYSLIVMAKKGTESSNATLTGRYGIVGFEAAAHDGSALTEIEGFYGVENLDGAGNATEELFDDYLLSRSPNSAPAESSNSEVEDFEYQVTSDGTLTLPGAPDSDIGFVIDNGEAFVLYSHDTSKVENTITQVSNGMTLGLKLPEATPTMAGKEYRLDGIMFGYGDQDTVLSSLSDAVLTFNSGSTVTLSAERVRGIDRSDDTSDLASFVEELGVLASNSATIIGNNGMFSTTLQLADGAEMTLDGFISADTGTIVFRTKYAEGNTREVGIFLGSLIAQ